MPFFSPKDKSQPNSAGKYQQGEDASNDNRLQWQYHKIQSYKHRARLHQGVAFEIPRGFKRIPIRLR